MSFRAKRGIALAQGRTVRYYCFYYTLYKQDVHSIVNYVTFVPKVTKGPGRCDSPRPPNAAQVWNASPATNRGNFKPCSLRSRAGKISSRFSQVSFHLLRPGNLLALRRLRYCYSGIFPEPLLCILLLCLCDSSQSATVQNDNPPVIFDDTLPCTGRAFWEMI